MKRHAIYGIAVALSILSLSIISCSDSENRHIAQLGEATVVIDLNLPEEHASTGILDRLRRLFVRDAVAQEAPATFGLIRVRVSGAGIGVIDREFAPYDVITINVPAGDLRYFEVIAYVSPGDPSAAASFRGTAVASLAAGATVSLPVAMSLYETKIVVPDTNNNRVVQKTSMHSGWAVTTFLDQPVDVDFDNRGRIYVIDQNTYDIYRFNNINDTEPQAIYGYETGGPLMWLYILSIDRNRNRLYCSDNDDIWQSDLSGASLPYWVEPPTKNLTTSIAEFTYTIQSIYGMDVAPDGMLYMVGSVNSAGFSIDAIIKYDPDANAGDGDIVSTTFHRSDISTLLNGPEDIQIKWPYLYITNRSGNDGYKILKFRVIGNSFELAGHFGNNASTYPDTPEGYFYAPHRFAGLNKDGLIVMDQLSTYSRLVFFANNLDSGWDTLGGFSGSGIDQFSFPFF